MKHLFFILTVSFAFSANATSILPLPSEKLSVDSYVIEYYNAAFTYLKKHDNSDLGYDTCAELAWAHASNISEGEGLSARQLHASTQAYYDFCSSGYSGHITIVNGQFIYVDTLTP